MRTSEWERDCETRTVASDFAVSGPSTSFVRRMRVRFFLFPLVPSLSSLFLFLVCFSLASSIDCSQLSLLGLSWVGLGCPLDLSKREASRNETTQKRDKWNEMEGTRAEALPQIGWWRDWLTIFEIRVLHTFGVTGFSRLYYQFKALSLADWTRQVV